MLNQEDFDYHLLSLVHSDADYVVDVLELTSEEILDAFPMKAARFIEAEYGNGMD
jgi:hypothetical protein